MPQMVARTGIINGDEKRTGYYTGILVSIARNKYRYIESLSMHIFVGISVLLVSQHL